MRSPSSISTWLEHIVNTGKLLTDTSHVPKRHPFKVCANGVHSPLVNAHSRAIIQERVLSVVQAGESVAVAIIGNLCPSQSTRQMG